MVTSCYTRLDPIRRGKAKREVELPKSASSAFHLDSRAGGGSQSGWGEESVQNQDNKDFCQLSFRVNIARMPVMGVLGGGGGRLQRSSSVGRGDVEARTLAPAQPPRRAHSFR